MKGLPMYDKVDSSLDFRERELEVLDFWEKEKIFERSVEERADAPRFTFYEGPPTANGKPHMGHVLTRVIKDIIPRYRTMKGYRVDRKAGWDTHGLPVELEVEKMLGINGKEQIEAYGVEPFIEQCKKSVWKYKQDWEVMSRRVGFWADMDNPYITYENDYIESVWWALKKIWEKGLLYHGHKVVPYCARCGTALSSHEVAQGYQDVTEASVYVRCRLKDDPDTYFAVWTTTPWTLPSNVALCVNADEDYALVESYVPQTDDTKKYYIAEALAAEVFGEEAKVIAKKKGSELVGMSYEPLFPYAVSRIEKSGKKAFVVVSDPYVTLTDGTGIVHLAPAFGEDDARIGRREDLAFVQLVGPDGAMTEEVTDFAGVFVKEADPGLMGRLEDEGKLIVKVPVEHSYPFCWRCDTPLIYYARSGWFIAMTKVRDALLEYNDTIHWIPESIKKGRFGNFLENVVDWALSRERYWGTPLPIWQCKSCGKEHVIGSIEELRKLAVEDPGVIELHKPYIDKVHLKCACGGEMIRVPEVIDCWFDSGAMPFAQWHYPFENEETFESSFPADFISEAIDQTRGWFYSLHAIATLLFDKMSYKNCIVLGHVLDKDGIKMSKHVGNVIDPQEILDLEGADAVRWYFFVGSQPWLPSRFSFEAVREVKRKYMGTLLNTYAFYVLYANIDEFEPDDYEFVSEQLNVMDRWILSKLNSLVKEVDRRLEQYDITQAGRALQAFVDDLSNWYVRRSRERYWQSGMNQDKIHAFLTLFTALKTVCELSAPFTPFISENIYQNLVRGHLKSAKLSVHLEDFPLFDDAMIDLDLEKQMQLVLDVVTLGRAARNEAAIKIRQPLPELSIVAKECLDAEFIALIRDELNVKSVSFLEDNESLLDYSFKPQLKVLGKRFGKHIREVGTILQELDGRKAMADLKANGMIKITVDGKEEALVEDDLLIEQKQLEGQVTLTDNGLTVSLSTELTDELIEEGFVREIISKVQTMRRDSGFEITDRITLKVGGNEKLEKLVEKNTVFISDEVLADSVEALGDEDGKEWNINGELLRIAVERR